MTPGLVTGPVTGTSSPRLTVIHGRDAIVGAWLFEVTKTHPMRFDMAVGIVDRDRRLVGAFMFTGFNGSEAEVHFYGPGTLTRGVWREMMRIAVVILRLNRLIIRTRKPSMSRGIAKLGAVWEGTQRRVYGPSDSVEHRADCWVMFRETMAKYLTQ
jgi:hypothetical protein